MASKGSLCVECSGKGPYASTEPALSEINDPSHSPSARLASGRCCTPRWHPDVEQSGCQQPGRGPSNALFSSFLFLSALSACAATNPHVFIKFCVGGISFHSPVSPSFHLQIDRVSHVVQLDSDTLIPQRRKRKVKSVSVTLFRTV